MKQLIIIVLTLMLSSTCVYAEGGKNQGTTGSGETSTGTSAQGDASQSRSGR